MSADSRMYEAAAKQHAEAESARNFAARIRGRLALHGQTEDLATWTTLEREAQGEMARAKRFMDHLNGAAVSA